MLASHHYRDVSDHLRALAGAAGMDDAEVRQLLADAGPKLIIAGHSIKNLATNTDEFHP